MRELLAVFAVLGVAAAIPLLGKEQCVQGPPVWCVNIRSAKQCNAVTHCQQTVWSRPTVNSVPCEFCKEVVTVVAGYLKDNATQQTILSTLEKICELIPDPSIGSECKQLIEEYYPLVINMIQEEMSNPGTVCCALGLCKSMQQHLASLQNPKQLLSNEIPDVQLDRLAPFMANVPLLLYPQEKKTEEKVKTEAKDVCQDCLQLVLDVQDNLRGNTSFSRMLIENFLKQCDQYGGGFADVCKEYVNQYGDLVIQMIIQLHQPSQQICNGIGLCAAKDTAPPKEVIPAKLLVPAMKVQPAMELKPAMKVASKSSEESLPVCEMCKLVVEKVEDLLKDERTEARIQQALDKVCQILPSKYRAKCVDFVDTNLPALLQLFLQAAPPRAICLVLGCCSSREPKMVKLAADKPQSEVCEVCKMMMNYLESLLEKNDTEQKIEQALEKVCNFVPPSMFDECHQLIEQYGAMILQMLLQQIKPDLCCKELGFCPNTQKKLLGVEKCMWGPSYWCKDLETAGSCNAIEHCKRHVWS